MFFPGTPNIFVPGDSVFMLFKYMCNNILIEKEILKTQHHITSHHVHKKVSSSPGDRAGE